MHRVFLIVTLATLALVLSAVSGETVAAYKIGYWTRVRGYLMCRGGYVETWASLKTSKHSNDLVNVATYFGQFDMTSYAHNPGFFVSIRADCGCGGEYFELPLVPSGYQYRDYSMLAENNPYEYRVIDLANCSARRNPHI
uniref:Transthyretin-like family protein n=1 Tax=Panagrellus redivivus TaxID=6233 RepID=A0A7E4VHP9_PANRE